METTMETTLVNKQIVPGRQSARLDMFLAKRGERQREAGGYRGAEGHMPRMVLDTEVHWSWRNPLNLMPLTMIVLMLYAVVGTLL